MLDNKKAQVGETITWVVATLIIVVVLGISVFATISVSNEKTIFLDDKEKDFIATKSITNFLRNQDNIELLESKNYEVFEERATNLFNTLPNVRRFGSGGWNFIVSEGEEEIIQIFNKRITTIVAGKYDFFDTEIIFKQLKLRFWNECEGRCR